MGLVVIDLLWGLKLAQLGQIWYHFKARIKLLIEIEFFLAIGLKAAQYRDENTEF